MFKKFQKKNEINWSKLLCNQPFHDFFFKSKLLSDHGRDCTF
jgi:hypothetical protein